jgi:tetratricopeptide (TPR) repeat protein
MAAAVHELGEIQRAQENPDCTRSYEEAMRLCQEAGDQRGEELAAFNLGNAYMMLEQYDEGEKWLRKSLSLCTESDPLSRAGTLGQLGRLFLMRFYQTEEVEAAAEHLNTALSLYHQALDITPEENDDKLRIVYHQIGLIYGLAGRFDQASDYLRRAIRLEERLNNFLGAAQSRFALALFLRQANRFDDALTYARAALSNFSHYGENAAGQISKTHELIRDIEARKRG